MNTWNVACNIMLGLSLIQCLSPALSSEFTKADDGWFHVPDIGVYFYNKQLETWEIAREFCEIEGGKLLVLNSETETSAVMEILMEEGVPRGDGSPNVRGIWVGFSDQASEGIYITVDGDLVSSTGFNEWRKSQPDDYQGKEDCGQLQFPEGLYNDYTCEFHVPFMCEKNN